MFKHVHQTSWTKRMCHRLWGKCLLWHRLHYAREIGKRNFFATSKPSVHTKASRKQSFSKTLFKVEEFENAGFAFSEINMEPELFENYAITTLRIYSPEFASNPFRKWRVPDCDVFKFLWRSVNGKHLMRFESENFIFKLLWRNVNRALDDQAPSLLP